jgi:predicted DNA-binding transcriptional regulator YafY
MNRIDRLVAILIHLQSKRIVTAPEIAERFGMSLRTIYRDIRALEDAGVPIGAEAGRGYYIVEGYHLPPIMFTTNEASAMLMAEKLVEKMTDVSVNNHFTSAANKIKAVLPFKEKEFIELLHPTIEVLFSRPPASADFPNTFLVEIQNSLVSKNILIIDYKSSYKKELTQNRHIEPIGLCYYSFGWHLIAFCRLRNEYRDFRVDQIKNLKISEEKFVNRKGNTISDYFKNLINNSELTEVTVRFDKSVWRELNYQKYYYGYSGEKELSDYIEASFATNSLSYFSHWLIAFGNKAMPVTPPELIDLLKTMALELHNQYLK